MSHTIQINESFYELKWMKFLQGLFSWIKSKITQHRMKRSTATFEEKMWNVYVGKKTEEKIQS